MEEFLPPISIIPAGHKHLYSITVMTEKYFPYTGFHFGEILRRMANPNIRYFVAIANGHTVGYIDFEAKPDRSTSQILGLGVLEEFRRHGIGRRLIERALEEIPEFKNIDGKPITRVELMVAENNEVAKKLYESHGFHRHGLLDRELGGSKVLIYVRE